MSVRSQPSAICESVVDNRHPGPASDPAPAALTWLGHATVLIELDGARLLTDPVLRRRVGPLIHTVGGLDATRLRRVDGILLSHLHADHADPRSLHALGRDVRIVAPTGSGRWLGRRGLTEVIEVTAGDRVNVAGVEVCATPAVHDDRRWPWGREVSPVGYLVRGSRSIYFAGDTDLFARLGEMRGTVDVALLPVWGWGRTLGPGHLDPERAAIAVALIDPALAIPIHWGTLALAWRRRRAPHGDGPEREFARRAEHHAPTVEVRVLRPGERTEL